ncbi:NADH dehydrogenase [Pseudomonas aeruginosa]|nr:NADH dehydrogenase [Pseudomonas aeruginosa]
MVRPTLQTTRDDDIFAFGDCAACPQPAQPGAEPRNVPPRAQAAHQQASLLVKSLRARLDGKPLGDYHYRRLRFADLAVALQRGRQSDGQSDG